MELSLRSQALKRALTALPERERQVVVLRYGLAETEPKTLEEIGRRLGLTRERVRQIELDSLKRLASLREMESVESASLGRRETERRPVEQGSCAVLADPFRHRVPGVVKMRRPRLPCPSEAMTAAAPVSHQLPGERAHGEPVPFQQRRRIHLHRPAVVAPGATRSRAPPPSPRTARDARSPG